MTQSTHETHHGLLRDGRDPTLPADHPINKLSAGRKFAILCVLSFSGFMANFSIAILQVAFVPMGKTFGVSPGQIPETIGYNLLGLGCGPILWNPLSKTLGRRPVYLIGSALFIPCAIWMALSPSYNCFVAARVVTGLVTSFSQTVPPSTVADIFVREVRGSKMSMFGVAVVIAPSVAPIFCGLIINTHSWRICFWLITALAGLQFILFYFIVPETLWIVDEPADANVGMKHIAQPVSVDSKIEEEHIESSVQHASALRMEVGHVGMAWYPWQRPGEFVQMLLSPILMVRFIPITLTAIYYGSVFAWSVGITIVMPQKFEHAPYSFATIPLGAAFLAFGIGGILGKWSGGIVGDKVVSRFSRKTGSRQPEHRLWALIPILPFMLVAAVIVGITIKKELHWIAYLMGGGLFFFCLSATTGLLQTYVLETYITRSMDTQAVFNFFKCMWGFAISFFVYEWGSEHGFLGEYVAQGCLAAGVGALLLLLLIPKGYEIRQWQGMPVTART